jgi:hypothetical protein
VLKLIFKFGECEFQVQLKIFPFTFFFFAHVFQLTCHQLKRRAELLIFSFQTFDCFTAAPQFFAHIKNQADGIKYFLPRIFPYSA